MDPEANLEELRRLGADLLEKWDEDDGKDIDTQPLFVARGFVSDDEAGAKHVEEDPSCTDQFYDEDWELIRVIQSSEDLEERLQRIQEIRQDAYRMAELFNALDGWLKGGGFSPKSWREPKQLKSPFPKPELP